MSADPYSQKITSQRIRPSTLPSTQAGKKWSSADFRARHLGQCHKRVPERPLQEHATVTVADATLLVDHVGARHDLPRCSRSQKVFPSSV